MVRPAVLDLWAVISATRSLWESGVEFARLYIPRIKVRKVVSISVWERALCAYLFPATSMKMPMARELSRFTLPFAATFTSGTIFCGKSNEWALNCC